MYNLSKSVKKINCSKEKDDRLNEKSKELNDAKTILSKKENKISELEKLHKQHKIDMKTLLEDLYGNVTNQ
ncbi:hypothetical protein HK099_007365 [Clydaea vesicula]|uniref:Uncharacterized protein n=1 Tax=Clydaea vesicula TaxID=447962 RepID=A0AAD5XWF4_9FUNG|nr:hypothetical protein HK099_007365 [Clydaea vesicula]